MIVLIIKFLQQTPLPNINITNLDIGLLIILIFISLLSGVKKVILFGLLLVIILILRLLNYYV